METRRIGSLEVSLVGLGCNNFGMRIDEEQTGAVVRAALDQGITLFDTADTYGGTKSEEFLGRALGKRRDEAVIATKFGSPLDDERKGAKPDYVVRAVEDSLRRLGTDRIDLYQLHFPDAETPIEDTLGALHGLVEAGKVREIGCSNFTVEQIEEASAASESRGISRFASVQNYINVLRYRGVDELCAACAQHGMGILPYFPLESGLLTGKYRRGEAPPAGTRLGSMPEERREQALKESRLQRVEKLEAFAAERGRTILELAFGWLITRPEISSVIAGATKPEQVEANAAAATWMMTDEEMAGVLEAVSSV